MRILENLLTAVFLYLFIFTAPSTAHIVSLNLQSNNRQMIPLSDFEFTNAGYVSFVFTSIAVTSTSSPTNASHIGFCLQSHDYDFYLRSLETRNQDIFEFQQNTTICPLDFKSNSSVLFTFQNLSHGPQFSFNKSFHVTYSGINSLFFVNCNNESLVTMEGHAELYNIDDGNGTTKNFLSAELTQLPFLYIIFSFIYLSSLGFWILVCFKNRRIFNRTHLLMGGLLLVNCVHFMCVAADLHHVKMTGTAHGLDVVFFIFQLMTAVLLSTVIVLIGAGWFFWKPFLKREEELVLMIVIVLEVWANVDPILPWEAAVPYNKENGSLADVIYCFAIYFSIALSSILLDEIRETDLNGDKNKLWLFMMLTIVYVLITKLFLLALSTRWEVYVVKETTILVFCMSIIYIFRPVDRARITNAAETTGLSTSNSISCFYSPV